MYYIKMSAVGCSGDSTNRRRKNKILLTLIIVLRMVKIKP
nr:MAG TPA: hypothetical protein [Caudoviricetes sp.]